MASAPSSTLSNRQYWTDEGLEAMLLLRADRDNAFEAVLGKGKGKKNNSSETQGALWEKIAQDLQHDYSHLTVVKNYYNEPEEISGPQCANKFYYLHSKLRSQASQVEQKDKDLPKYLLIPKILFHMLIHTRTGSSVTASSQAQEVPADRNKAATKAVAEYVRQQVCPSVDPENTEPVTQDIAKKVAEDDSVESWMECVQELNIDIDQALESEVSSRKRQRMDMDTANNSNDSTASKSTRRDAHGTHASGTQGSSGHDINSDDKSMTDKGIEEKSPPMSFSPTSQSKQGERSTSAKVGSAKSKKSTSYSTSSSPRKNSSTASTDTPKYLIFEEDPFSDVIVKKNSSVYPATNGTVVHQDSADNSSDSSIPYRVDPRDRLRDVILYHIKEERMTDESRKTLTLVYTALHLEKYKPIFMAVALLACPDNHFMDMNSFITLIAEKLQQLGLTFNRVSMELARKY